MMGLKYDPVPTGDEEDPDTYEWWNMPEMIPAQYVDAEVFNNASNPDERGLDFEFDTEQRISGAVFNLLITEDVDVDFVLYDCPTGGAGVLETVSMTVKPNVSLGAQNVVVKFNQDHFIAAHEIYKIMVKPSSATNVGLEVMYFNDSLMGEKLTGWTDKVNNHYFWGYQYKNDGGAWQDYPDATKMPLISLLVTGFQGTVLPGWLGDA
jgi:hypothetical protein